MAVKYLGGKAVTISMTQMVAACALAGWPQAQWAKAAAVASAESSRVLNVYNDVSGGHFGVFQIGKTSHPDYFSSLSNANGWVDPQGNAAYAYQLYQSQGWSPWVAETTGAFAAFLAQATIAAGSVAAQIKSGKPVTNTGIPGGVTGSQAVLASYMLQPGSANVTAQVVALQLNEDVNAAAAGIAGASGDVGTAGVQVLGTAVDSLQSGALGFLGELMNPATWARVAYVIGGGALALVGLYVLAKPAVDGAAGGIAKVATGATPVGRAVKAVKGRMGS